MSDPIRGEIPFQIEGARAPLRAQPKRAIARDAVASVRSSPFEFEKFVHLEMFEKTRLLPFPSSARRSGVTILKFFLELKFLIT